MVTHVVNKLEVVKYLTKVYGTNKADLLSIPDVGKKTSMMIIADFTLYNIKRHIAYHVFYSTLENENSDGMIERLRVIIEADGNTNTTSPTQEDDISIQDEIKEYCARIPKKTDYGYQYKLF